MDCGPTCLRMIAKHYGKEYSIAELRKKSFINREGVSILGISEAAEAIGFRTLSAQVPFKILKSDVPLPCIVHWSQRHFVVVYKTTEKRITVADPAAGLVNYTHEEFNKQWSAWKGNDDEHGVALFLEPTPAFFEQEEDEQPKKRTNVTDLFAYLHSYRRQLIQLAISLLIGSLIQLAFPFLTQSIVDVGIKTRDINFIYLVLGGQLALMIGKTSVDFFRRWILLHLSTRINIAIISDFLIKLMQLPLSFFDQKTIGDILRRIEDHTRIETFLSSSSLNIIFSFFNFIVFGIVLLTYNISIFFIFAAGSALYVVYILLFMKKRKELDHRRFAQLSVNQGNLIELIHGIHDIKLNNCEKQKRWEWERVQKRLYQISMSSTRLQQYQEAGSLFINESKNMLITVVAAQAVISGSMTLGMMVAVQFIIGQLNAPIIEFVGFIREYQDAKISVERIGEIHDQENEDTKSIRFGLPWSVIASQTNDITLTNLSFHYPEPDAPWVLENINLTLPRGKVTAIVGESGSGKTTLLKLLLKFFPPVKGSLRAGELEMKMINSGAWRSKCGVVMQDGYIFSGTIAANIALAGEEIDYTKLFHAASVANIHEHIQSLPFGYNTRVEAKGAGLSQGQKQRILIARAVYKDPEYLFFDEATSSLDANNEKVIMNKLNEFFAGRTVVVIAHRLSTVKNADQIVVLDKGRIAEQGTHEELTQARGAYYELVKNQLDLGD